MWRVLRNRLGEMKNTKRPFRPGAVLAVALGVALAMAGILAAVASSARSSDEVALPLPPEDLQCFCCMGRRTIQFLRLSLLILRDDIARPGRAPKLSYCRALPMRSGITGLGSARP